MKGTLYHNTGLAVMKRTCLKTEQYEFLYIGMKPDTSYFLTHDHKLSHKFTTQEELIDAIEILQQCSNQKVEELVHMISDIEGDTEMLDLVDTLGAI